MIPRRAPVLPIVAPTEADCAYAAGYLDGEGYIAIHRKGRTGTPGTWSMAVQITGTVPAPFHWLQARWGGYVLVLRPPAPRRVTFMYTLNPRAALRFLLDVRPWLLIKGEQADVAITFQQSRRPPGDRPSIDKLANRAEGAAANLRLVQIRKEA